MRQVLKGCRLAVLAGMAAVGLLLLPLGAHAADQIVFKVGYLGPADVNINYEHAMGFAFKSALEARTDGKIKVELYPGGTLGSQEEMFEMTRKNAIQAVLPSEGVIGRWFPEIQAFGIPFLYSSLPVAWAVQDGPLGLELKGRILEKTGLRTIGISDVGGPNVFATNKRPIRSAADLKGLKIRTMAHEGHIATIKALGAAATPMPFAEVYTSLQTGVIDGHFNPVSAMITFRMYEVQKFLSLTGHLYGAMYLLMNDKAFQGLSPEFQEAVLISGRQAAVAARGVNRILEANGLETLKTKGMTLVTPTAGAIKEMKTMAQPPVIKTLKEKFGAAWVDKILAAVEDGEKRVLAK
ncbi:MAG: TRAP transporter substrate-binding protein [Candidatus Methylomirabilales bacterium]